MITGSVQISKGYYYTVLNLYNELGKRKPKWISTGLKVENNQRKNQANRKQAEKIKDNEVLKANMEVIKYLNHCKILNIKICYFVII